MISENQKTLRYKRLYEQLRPLLNSSPTFEAKLATINAVLYHKVSYIFWIGFYFLNENRLCVGPYQGPLACQELEYPKGVCWKSIISGSSVIVPDVTQFKDHIACDARSRSEIVLPIYDDEQVIAGVLDIDSDQVQAFDSHDESGLKKIVSMLWL
jgi:GAF domain-containing protein